VAHDVIDPGIAYEQRPYMSRTFGTTIALNSASSGLRDAKTIRIVIMK
jgi:hypothetical protein